MDIKGELQDNFAFLISSLSSSTDIEQFFETFLTDEEKTMLTKRLMLYLMFENKYTSAEIARVLGFSRETVRTHRYVWGKSNKKYRQIIASVSKRRKTKIFWSKVERALKPLELALQAKSNMKARAKLLSGDYE